MHKCRTDIVFPMNAAAWLWYFTVLLLRSTDALALRVVMDYPIYPVLTPGLPEYCPEQPGPDFNKTILCSIKLPCADGYLGKHRSGTTSLYHYPKSSCSVTFELDGGCPDTYAIYFNIKRFNLPLRDSVQFYDKGMLIREIHGGHHESPSWPNSVAQVLSAFSHSPSLKFVFEKDEFSVVEESYANYITLDYTVVRGGNRNDESDCSALGGYVPDLYFCDVTNDRINCPATYDSRLPGLNPAEQTQIGTGGTSPQCIEKTTVPYDYQRSATDAYETGSNNNVEWYVIIIVVLVSLGVLFLILRACFYLYASQKAAATDVRRATFSRARHPAGPTADIDRLPSFAASPLPGSESFMGAPPSYATVFPTGPIPDPPPSSDPPKYESI